MLVKVGSIDQFLIDIKANSKTTGTATSASIVITYLIQIMMLITTDKFSTTMFTEVFTKIEAITSVAVLTREEVTIFNSLIKVLTMVELITTAELSGASQGLIANKGLLVRTASTTLSFVEQAKAIDKQLETNRANYDGMDKAVKALKEKVKAATTVCKDKFDDDDYKN